MATRLLIFPSGPSVCTGVRSTRTGEREIEEWREWVTRGPLFARRRITEADEPYFEERE